METVEHDVGQHEEAPNTVAAAQVSVPFLINSAYLPFVASRSTARSVWLLSRPSCRVQYVSLAALATCTVVSRLPDATSTKTPRAKFVGRESGAASVTQKPKTC